MAVMNSDCNNSDECEEYLFSDAGWADKRGHQAEAILSKRMTQRQTQKKKKKDNKQFYTDKIFTPGKSVFSEVYFSKVYFQTYICQVYFFNIFDLV